MAPLNIQVIGQFELRDANNILILPKGKKEIAIVAMLACTPGKRLTRKIIQDTLWSDRSAEQAKTSLRQALYRIRRTLNGNRSALLADKITVSLDLDKVIVDLDEPLIRGSIKNADTPLLQGIDIGDHAFKNWLKRCREQHQIALVKGRKTSQTLIDNYTQVDSQSDTSNQRPVDCIGVISLARHSPLTPDFLLNNWFTDSIFTEASALGIADIRDLRTLPSDQAHTNTAYQLYTNTVTLGNTTQLSARLLDVTNGKTLWQSTLHFSVGKTRYFREATQRTSTGFIDFLIQWQKPKYSHYHYNLTSSTSQCLQGILVPGKIPIDEIENNLNWLLDQQPESIHYALKALLCTQKIGEGHSTLKQVQLDQLNHEMNRALELGSSNPITLAMLGHIHGFVLGDRKTALDLTQEALERLPLSPICAIFHSIALHYANKNSESVKYANLAWKTGSKSFVKPLLQSVLSSTHLLNGDLKKALYFAESAHSESQTFRPVLNILLISYTHEKQFGKAERVLTLLKERQPELSSGSIKSNESTIKNIELKDHLSAALQQHNH